MFEGSFNTHEILVENVRFGHIHTYIEQNGFCLKGNRNVNKLIKHIFIQKL